MFVSEYYVQRIYGGPEEGGWWYDYNNFKRAMGGPFPADDAYAISRAMNERERVIRAEWCEHDRFSVLGSGDVCYMAEDSPGEEQTKECQRYE